MGWPAAACLPRKAVGRIEKPRFGTPRSLAARSSTAASSAFRSSEKDASHRRAQFDPGLTHGGAHRRGQFLQLRRRAIARTARPPARCRHGSMDHRLSGDRPAFRTEITATVIGLSGCAPPRIRRITGDPGARCQPRQVRRRPPASVHRARRPPAPPITAPAMLRPLTAATPAAAVHPAQHASATTSPAVVTAGATIPRASAMPPGQRIRAAMPAQQGHDGRCRPRPPPPPAAPCPFVAPAKAPPRGSGSPPRRCRPPAPPPRTGPAHGPRSSQRTPPRRRSARRGRARLGAQGRRQPARPGPRRPGVRQIRTAAGSATDLPPW